MTDNLDIDLDQLDKDITRNNAVEERIKNLHSQKKEAEEKAAAEAKARADIEKQLNDIQKEKDFYSGFSDSVSKFPQATEYKDKIKEKFNAGYSLEDATIAILHAEGKLNSQSRIDRQEAVFGGSAPTQINLQHPQPGVQMTQTERLEELRKAEARGDISLS